MKVLKLKKDFHWKAQCELSLHLSGVSVIQEKVINSDIIKWLKEQYILYIKFYWHDNIFIVFLRQRDATLFKLTWF